LEGLRLRAALFQLRREEVAFLSFRHDSLAVFGDFADAVANFGAAHDERL
jgi:hypothetical protein